MEKPLAKRPMDQNPLPPPASSWQRTTACRFSQGFWGSWQHSRSSGPLRGRRRGRRVSGACPAGNRHLGLPVPRSGRGTGHAGAAAPGIVARGCDGPDLIFVDDDMEVPGDFVERHLWPTEPDPGRWSGAIHPPRTSRRCLSSSAGTSGPWKTSPTAFEKGRRSWETTSTPETSRCPGGLPRRGGFDRSLGHSEDAELGLRLEEAASRSNSAMAHGPSTAPTREPCEVAPQAELYGVFDQRIARKHPGIRHASPWRFWKDLRRSRGPSCSGRPGANALPARRRPRVCRGGGAARLGAERVAISGTTLAYGIAYYRGVRLETVPPGSSSPTAGGSWILHRTPRSRARDRGLDSVGRSRRPRHPSSTRGQVWPCGPASGSPFRDGSRRSASRS